MSDTRHNIVVTGATGFLGESLACQLKEQGHMVEAFVVEDSPRLRSAGIPLHFVEWSALGLAAKLKALGTTSIIHLAGVFRREHRAEEIPALIAGNLSTGIELLEAARICGVHRFVAAGTSWEQFTPNSPDPVNLYAMLKRSLRDAMKYYGGAYGMSVLSLKIFDTYGPGDNRNKFLNLLVKHALSGEVLTASAGEQKLDLLHSDDVCAAFSHAGTASAFDRGGFQEYSLFTGRLVSLQELARMVASVSGRELRVEWGKRPYSPREVMAPHNPWTVLPGWQPQVGLREGIASMFGQSSFRTTPESK